MNATEVIENDILLIFNKLNNVTSYANVILSDYEKTGDLPQLELVLQEGLYLDPISNLIVTKTK
jgi:hypothetical protein